MHDLCDLKIRNELDGFTPLEVGLKQPFLQHINIFYFLDELRNKSDELALHLIRLRYQLRISPRQEITRLVHQEGTLDWISIVGQRHVGVKELLRIFVGKETNVPPH